MSKQLWQRGEPLDALIARFTVGRDPELDQGLLPYDALGSAAHATMLERIGILQSAELKPLLIELAALATDARSGSFTISASEEDCHTAIENRLTERLGDVGRKVHTGRSRNDQVISVMRLWGREAILAQCDAALSLVALLVRLAEAHRETTVAGYTHTRQAMPSTFGQLFACHAETLLDDLAWLQRGFAHINRSPLGSASGYGVALPLDRPLVAELLRFDGVQVNSIAVQNDRGKTEYLLLSNAAVMLTDLARLASDVIFFSTEELGYIKLADQVTTGSSIMPQKRNPDVLELIRAFAAKIRARQAETGAIYGGLSSGYHRDLQLTKEPFLEGMQTCADALKAMAPVLETMRIDKERCAATLERSIGATDAVYQRVAEGTPFRIAYKEIAADPAGAVKADPAAGWRARTHLGAPGALSTDPILAEAERQRAWLSERQASVAAAWTLLPSQAQ